MALVPIAFTVLTLVAALAPDRAIVGTGPAASTQAEADADGLTPLMRAAARGDLAQVAALLGKGSEPDASTPAQRVTALMCAAYFGHAAVIKALLAKGARRELKDAQGAAAVDWAALGDHPELEKALTGPNVSLNPFLNTGIMPIWLMDKAAGQ
jgi:ankyrin repeat protein